MNKKFEAMVKEIADWRKFILNELTKRASYGCCDSITPPQRKDK